MSNPKISVIIPVYNVEKYLGRCLDSVINQSFRDFELILINDGSKDDSLSICNDYSAADSRITVIDQPNQGSSIARNTGLDVAKGDYIIHIDSDDWLELNMLERLYETAVKTDADIVACNICQDDGNGNCKNSMFDYSIEKEENLYYIKNITVAVWNKLVRRGLYYENDIKFLPGITMCEDLVVTTRLRYHSKKTVIIPDVLYHYFVAPRESICNTFKGKYPDSKLRVAEFLDDYLHTHFPERKSVDLTVNNLKLYVTWDILENRELGGCKEWRRLLNSSSKFIMKCQFPLFRKLIMQLARILPPKIFDSLFFTGKSHFGK